ncbi:hypothetical protein [Candidatus Arsenophonus triatominarum]|uniref:hypothetical protein n=1 Tax=Candidatus Arsenophonus triatominarum TaxID=57911 RepID=UPI0007C5078D|nr:hypothetical protein [Candidatus Arsenophonus triatominarum]
MAVNINRIAPAHTTKTDLYLGEMIKFEELSEKSQDKASEALLYALQAEMDSNRIIDKVRAKALASAIGDGFIALEIEESEKNASKDSGKNNKNFGFANS